MLAEVRKLEKGREKASFFDYIKSRKEDDFIVSRVFSMGSFCFCLDLTGPGQMLRSLSRACGGGMKKKQVKSKKKEEKEKKRKEKN